MIHPTSRPQISKCSAEKNCRVAEKWQSKCLRASITSKSTLGFYFILSYVFLLKILFLSPSPLPRAVLLLVILLSVHFLSKSNPDYFSMHQTSHPPTRPPSLSRKTHCQYSPTFPSSCSEHPNVERPPFPAGQSRSPSATLSNLNAVVPLSYQQSVSWTDALPASSWSRKAGAGNPHPTQVNCLLSN